MDDDQNIGLQDPDADDMPSEMKDHMLAAFRHEAGLGPHPGAYKGPKKRKGAKDDDPTETDLESARQEEANAPKMHAAQTGGATDPSLAPSEMEQTAVKQRGSINKQADQQAAAQAAQAQGAQAPINAPPAPTGPAGTTTAFPAQQGSVGGPGNAQQPQQQPPPSPAPDEAPPEGESDQEDPSTQFPS